MTASLTVSTASSRMHLWWPSGQTAGPWAEQGRQRRPACPSARLRASVGPKPCSGTVGPKIATTGVPTAVARCNGAESLVTSVRARPITAAEARRPSAPAALHARPGAAATISSASGASSRPPITTIGPSTEAASAG